MKKLRFILLTSLCVLGLAGGAVFALAGSNEPADGIYSVELSDGKLTVESPVLDRGRHQIELTNTGTKEHELVILKTDKAADELAVGLHGVSIELSGELIVGEDHHGLGHDHGADQVLGLLPGESRRSEVDLASGNYVAYCQTDGHYLGGEAVGFTVR